MSIQLSGHARIQLFQLEPGLLYECFRQRAMFRHLFYESGYGAKTRLDMRVLYEQVENLKPEDSLPSILLWKERSSEACATLVSLESFIKMLQIEKGSVIFGHRLNDYFLDLIERGEDAIRYYEEYIQYGIENKDIRIKFAWKLPGEGNPLASLMELYVLFCKELYSMQEVCSTIYQYNNKTGCKQFIPFSYILDRFAADQLVYIEDCTKPVTVLDNGVERTLDLVDSTRKKGTWYNKFDNGVQRFNKEDQYGTNIVLYCYNSKPAAVGRLNTITTNLGKLAWRATYNLPESIDYMQYKDKLFEQETPRTDNLSQVWGQYIYVGCGKLFGSDAISETDSNILKDKCKLDKNTFLLNYPFLSQGLQIDGRSAQSHMLATFNKSWEPNEELGQSFGIQT